MPIYHNYFEQRSAEWYRLRLGIPTASEIQRIITPTGKPSKQALGYMNRLLAEWVLGEPIRDEYQSDYMQQGEENEAAAVKAFEFQTGLETQEVGFVTTDSALVGCSPDRLVGEIGTLELKSPAAQTQICYLRERDLVDQLQESITRDTRKGSAKALSNESEIDELVRGVKCVLAKQEGTVAEEYAIQVQSQLWICEREKSWVSSYHPKLPWVGIEIPRDDRLVQKIAAAVNTFVDVMLEKRLELERRFGPFVRKSDVKRKPAFEEAGFSFAG